jgi:hypothetical protein
MLDTELKDTHNNEVKPMKENVSYVSTDDLSFFVY